MKPSLKHIEKEFETLCKSNAKQYEGKYAKVYRMDFLNGSKQQLISEGIISTANIKYYDSTWELTITIENDNNYYPSYLYVLDITEKKP